MSEPLEIKEAKLLDFIRQYKSVLVAYSGGLDSTMVLWASIKAIGADNVYAATSESESFASGEAEDSNNLPVKSDFTLRTPTPARSNRRLRFAWLTGASLGLRKYAHSILQTRKEQLKMGSLLLRVIFCLDAPFWMMRIWTDN